MSDEHAQSDLDLITAGRRALRELPDAPQQLIRRAEAIWPRSPGLLRRIQALLSVDSWSTPLPALRSGGSRARQLLFTAEARDIDLRVAPGTDGWTLEGQVLGPSDEGTLSVQREGAAVATVALDELGAFHVAGLAEGRYELVLYFASERVALPALDVRAQDAP